MKKIKKMAVGGASNDCPKGTKWDGTRCISTISSKIGLGLIGGGLTAGGIYIGKKSKANRDARKKEKEEVKRYAKEGGWIQGAIKRPGAFTAKAKAAGMSTSAFAKSVLKEDSKASTRTKRQAALAQTLGKMRKKK
jgi:hypothetical protein